MTHYPPSPIQERRRKLVRNVGIALSALMVVTVLSILVLIVRSESAHDEASCPFAKLDERTFGDAQVVEEARSCLPEVEERRWLVARPGRTPREFARKRLDKARFASERFSWELEEDEDHKVVLRMDVDGQLLSEFREADSETK
jgi:hypothetical protein